MHERAKQAQSSCVLWAGDRKHLGDRRQDLGVGAQEFVLTGEMPGFLHKILWSSDETTCVHCLLTVCNEFVCTGMYALVSHSVAITWRLWGSNASSSAHLTCPNFNSLIYVLNGASGNTYLHGMWREFI